MIVPNMNISEIANEVRQNADFIMAKIKNFDRKMGRIATKTKKPISKFELTKDKVGNSWYIFMNVTKKYSRIAFGVYYLDSHKNFNVIELSYDDEIQNSLDASNKLIHYTAHFFERYNERFLQKDGLTKIDILKHYLVNNYSTSINVRADYTSYCIVNDGMCLGDYETINGVAILHNRTFITNDLYFDNQKAQYNQGIKEIDGCKMPENLKMTI